MKVRVKQWTAVAAWHWDMPEDDVCGICRNPYDSTCAQCRYPGEECPLRTSCAMMLQSKPARLTCSPVMGECNHSFHMHCIVAWVRQETSQERCPMCRQGIVSGGWWRWLTCAVWKEKAVAAKTEPARVS
jgi:anaphase-promoting complex subunit 11